MKRNSTFGLLYRYSWNHLVSVRAGISNTTTSHPPIFVSKHAFLTHSEMLEYGGLHYTLPLHGRFRASSACVKNRRHFRFCFVAQASRLKWNSESRAAKKSCGVSHSSLLLLNRTFCPFNFQPPSYGSGSCAPRRCRRRRRSDGICITAHYPTSSLTSFFTPRLQKSCALIPAQNRLQKISVLIPIGFLLSA